MKLPASSELLMAALFAATCQNINPVKEQCPSNTSQPNTQNSAQFHKNSPQETIQTVRGMVINNVCLGPEINYNSEWGRTIVLHPPKDATFIYTPQITPINTTVKGLPSYKLNNL